jgi:hypothetical protein
LLLAAENGRPAAVIIDEFDPPHRIAQIRIRGAAVLEAHDPDRVYRIYRRYLGASVDAWPLSFPERLNDRSWVLWSVSPDSGLVADYRNFAGDERRWHRLTDCPFLDGVSDIS